MLGTEASANHVPTYSGLLRGSQTCKYFFLGFGDTGPALSSPWDEEVLGGLHVGDDLEQPSILIPAFF